MIGEPKVVMNPLKQKIESSWPSKTSLPAVEEKGKRASSLATPKGKKGRKEVFLPVKQAKALKEKQEKGRERAGRERERRRRIR